MIFWSAMVPSQRRRRAPKRCNRICFTTQEVRELRGILYLLNSCDTSLYIIHFIVNFLAVNRKLRLPTSF